MGNGSRKDMGDAGDFPFLNFQCWDVPVDL